MVVAAAWVAAVMVAAVEATTRPPPPTTPRLLPTIRPPPLLANDSLMNMQQDARDLHVAFDDKPAFMPQTCAKAIATFGRVQAADPVRRHAARARSVPEAIPL